MIKFLFFIFELIGGLSYATHKFRSRCKNELDSKKVWHSTAVPKNKLIRWLEYHTPPRIFVKIGMYFFHKTKIFKIARLGIIRHYDISNDFYELFLDKEFMFYSFGDFHKESDTLEEAQENKANYLARLIDPKPNEKILDLGCGWGSMMKKIINITGDRENITGYNLSEAQVHYVRNTLGYNVELTDLLEADYPENYFDKIYSVGMMEHIRNKDLEELSRKLHRTLKKTGRIVHHFFCQKENLPPGLLLVALDIFPGSELASFDTHRKVFESTGFKIVQHTIHDYRRTLQSWFNRLAANKNKAIKLVGIRNYNRYLSYLAYAYRLFDEHLLVCNRFVLEPVNKQVELNPVNSNAEAAMVT